MFSVILMTALMGQCEGTQCDVPFAAGISVATEAEARQPMRGAVRFVRERKPLRTRIARLREDRPVWRVVRRLRRW